ncbi:MAG: hypothetical protein JNN15_20115, partial [Blastocatellia bacterium]|nr:hypothetical protein [Blastocatellia bacterium]
EEVSKIVAIDNFQECINRLEKAKFIFVEHESITDLQTNVSLLAKFLPRVGRVNEARRKTDIWLKVAEEKGYLFNRAQLLYQQSQIAVYQGLEDLGVEKSLECLEICSRIGVEKFTLYPLLLMSQVQAEFGQSDAAFTRSVDGIIGSLKYQNPAFTSQFLQYAGLASFGLNMPELAEAYIKESIRISTQEEMFGYLAVAKTALAALLAEKGKFAKAKQLIEETKTEDISRISEPIAKKQHLFRVSGYEGKVYGLAREFSKAEQSYRKSLRLAEELGYEKILGLYQNVQGLGESLREQDKNHEALKELLKAKDIYQKSVVNLRIKGKNRLLDVTFSGRGIDEAISLVKTKR